MKVLIYTRVSTDEQANKGFSLRQQKDFLELYCQTKGHLVDNHFQDDYSAKDFNRPSFIKMLNYIKGNHSKIEAIVFTKWDRFSRNSEESLRMIKKLRGLGIEVIAAEQPLDMANPDNKMMLSLYLTLPEIENDKISMRTRDGLRKAMKEGCYCSRSPFGYDNWRTPDGKSSLKPNDKSKLILKAFKLFSKGLYTAEEVRKKLYSEGLKMTKQNFNYLLRNVVYNGRVLIKAYGKEEAQIVDGLHDAIVPNRLFETVQKVFKDRRVQPYIKKRNERYPLRGYLLCPRCKINLTASASRGRSGARFEYYHCKNGCRTRHRADLCNSELYALLKSFDLKPEIIELYEKVLLDTFSENEDDQLTQIKRLQKEKKVLSKNIEKVQDKLIKDDIDKETFNSINKRYHKQISEKDLRIIELKSLTAEVKKYIKEGVPVLKNLHSVYFDSSIEVQQKILGSIFPGKLIFDGKNYRTDKMNEVIFLMTSKNRLLRKGIKKQTAKNNGLSSKAPLLGLEPRTL